MAIFFGRPSKFLIHEDHAYFFWAIVVVALPLLIIAILATFAAPGIVVGVAVVLLLFALKWLEPLTFSLQHQSAKFYKGRFGEYDIQSLLKQLPDSYTIFQSVVLDKQKGDIDFVLVGPQGLCVLEVKSLGGTIGFDGQMLTINGKKQEGKNFLEQTFGEARALSWFIRNHLGFDVYAKPVLVFSNRYASLNFDEKPVDNVYVTQKDLLFDLVYSFPQYHWQTAEREKLEALLRVVVSS